MIRFFQSYFKIIFACLLAYVFVYDSYAQNEVRQNGHNVFYFPNGKISSEGEMKEGKPDGFWKSYYESGQLKSEGNRVNFKLDGIWKLYNEKGVLTSEL